MKKTYIYSFALLMSIALFTACSKKSNNPNVSSKTGYAYNQKANGGFEVNTKYRRGPGGTGLMQIEGGEFIMGGSAIDIPGQDMSNYNYKREVTVSSFYMDETEVANVDWLEYLNWIKRNYPTDAQYYYEELPDTLVWRRPLSFNEPYVNNYLRHPAYANYPVVGVTALQAERYCVWRTDMVNEKMLRDKGYMQSFAVINGTAKGKNAAAAPVTKPATPFNTDIYLNGQIDDKGTKAMPDLNPAATATGAAANSKKNGPTRNVRLEDGVILQPFRLPTEAEWEYAALGLIGNTQYENVNEKKIYPWNGLGVSSAKRSTRGLILANFKRAKGDYMGVGGSLNDKAAFTQNVRAYEPNDFGLYNMAGNVNEWTADVFRVATYEQADALNPFRGNQYQNKDRDPITGKLKQDKYGKPEMVKANSGVKQTWAELQAGKSASTGTSGTAPFNPDQRGYRDEESKLYGITTLVNNKSRVYKGGSWDDQAQWLNPAARRHLQEDESTADIGFRCAMTMLGSAEINPKGKPQFKNGR